MCILVQMVKYTDNDKIDEYSYTRIGYIILEAKFIGR